MRRALFVPVLVLSLLLGTSLAFAGSKTDALVKTLREDSSFKVRAKAAEILGKSKDPDAIPPLIEALKKDSNELVRAYAASALASLAASSGDADALKALKAAASSDSSSLVRTEAEKAVARFPAATPTPSGGGYLIGDVYIELGKFTDNGKVKNPELLSKFQALLDKELAAAGKKASAPPKGKKAITLDGALQKVDSKTSKGSTAITVALSITVTRERSILAIVQKEAEIAYDGKLSPREESSGREEVLEVLIPETYNDLKKNLPKWK